MSKSIKCTVEAMKAHKLHSLLFLLHQTFLQSNSQTLESVAVGILNNLPLSSSTRLDVVAYSNIFNVKYFLESLSLESSLTVKVSNRKIPKLSRTKIKLCLMISDDVKSFIEAFRKFKLTQFDSHGIFLIIFTGSSSKDDKRLIFKIALNKSMVNVNILQEANPASFELSTFIPFQNQNCRSTEPVTINKFVNSTWATQEFFPDKIKNLQKCPIKFACHEAVTSKGRSEYEKIDFKALSMVAAALNFTPKRSNRTKPAYSIAETRKTYGLINQVVNGYSDVVLGYYSELKKSKLLETSHPYFYFRAASVVQPEASSPLIGHWMRSFHWSAWLVLLAVLTCGCIFLVHCKFQVTSCGKKLTGGTTKISARIGVATIIMFSLFVQIIYQSNMISNYQTPNKAVKPLRIKEEMKAMMPVSMFFIRDSYMKRPFDEKITTLQSCGLLTYYANSPLKPKKEVKDEPEPLTMKSFLGIFFILIVGWPLSFVVFLVEAANAKGNNKRNR